MIFLDITPNESGTIIITASLEDEIGAVIELASIPEEDRRYQLMYNESGDIVGDFTFANSLIPPNGEIIFTKDDLNIDPDNELDMGERYLTFRVAYTNQDNEDLQATEGVFFTIENLPGL